MKSDTSIDSTHLAWLEIQTSAPQEARARVSAVVHEHANELATLFYRSMLQDADASRYLDHAIVQQRLHASLERWLRQLFDDTVAVAGLIAEQRRTGEVHARIGISMDLIGHAARILKRAICQRVAETPLPAGILTGAIQYVYELVSLAIGTMNLAYESNASRIARSDEAYRLLFLGRDMRAERERQRTHLLEWSQQIQLQHYWDIQGDPQSDLSMVTESPFGLWLKHKAAMLFEGAPELDSIQAAVDTIEQELLPRLQASRASREEARRAMSAVTHHIETIKSLMTSMFDRLIEGQDGRDAVTQLLNRRFFPVVAKREITLANGRSEAFALVILEIDHFARLRLSSDLDAPDHILSQVAEALQDQVRAGDFVFRIGDERFAVILVEASRRHVLEIADGLRQSIDGSAHSSSTRLLAAVTVSVGIALFDGHPDYQRLLERAELALQRARQQGGNQCAIAE